MCYFFFFTAFTAVIILNAVKIWPVGTSSLAPGFMSKTRKNSDLAWIKAYGYEPIPLSTLKVNLNRFDIIINTIPYIILDKENLENVKRDALVIDLASNPGGVDRDAIKEQKIKFIWPLSLSGKVSPVTSAEFIKETLYNIFNEIKGE